MKKRIFRALIEIIIYIIAIIAVEIVAHKYDWAKSSVIDNVIGITVAFVLWEVIRFFRSRRKQKDI